ncbi:MAG TPA: hypothetical protein VLF59_03640 [Candidatus Saccharimonadales bacterium]|nr:hypothetical protein [Candidatus Saccharimonadales bacterium]
MENRSLLRTIIAALVGIGIVVVFIILMFRLIFGGSKPTEPAYDITKYADSAATVTLLIDGKTNIDQDHRQLRITVSATQNQVQLIQGYQGNVIDSRTYSNNSDAFAVFLQSLRLLNFTKGNTKSTVDYRGYCPSGQRYVYTFNDGQRDVLSYWTTSCSQGTYAGNRPGTRELFERQIPSTDLQKLDVTGVSLY